MTALPFLNDVSSVSTASDYHGNVNESRQEWFIRKNPFHCKVCHSQVQYYNNIDACCLPGWPDWKRYSDQCTLCVLFPNEEGESWSVIAAKVISGSRKIQRRLLKSACATELQENPVLTGSDKSVAYANCRANHLVLYMCLLFFKNKAHKPMSLIKMSENSILEIQSL